MASAAPPPPGREEGPGVAERLLERADHGMRHLRHGLLRIVPDPLVELWTGLGALINKGLPKGLLGRSVLIILLPMLILLSVLTFVFMDRHWALVTARLSAAVVRDIAAVVDLVESQPVEADLYPLLRTIRMRLDLSVTVMPADAFIPGDASLLGLLDRTLSTEIEERIGRPYLIDTGEERGTVEIRLPIDRGTLRVIFSRNLAYAANWHFFLVWMAAVASGVLIFSIVFIRNQIKPIQRLANAAEAFGKGRPVGSFAPQGAREVRKAAHAFIEMRRRIDRQIEQRTAMLAGVSHDLRTILTRFRLELALMADGEEVEALRRDVDEMEAMLEAYLAFAKGDVDEASAVVDVAVTLREVTDRATAGRVAVTASFTGDPLVEVRPNGLKRLVGNLVVNAVRHGRSKVAVSAEHAGGWLTIRVDDDGPGIPVDEREAVFRPFYRLDAARNQNSAGTGLGLAIARDIARSHGGEIRLEDSPLGGLCALVRLPG